MEAGGAPGEKSFPAIWLRLVAPVGDERAIRELVECAARSGTVLDISASPALFGGYMRATHAALMAVGPNDLARAVDDEQAHSLVLAHLVETLSAIGREYVDFYFLKVDGTLREDQISGALVALKEARDQGNLRYIGIAAKDSRSALAVMHLHDVFDAVVVYEEGATSRPLRLLAESRGMAVICANGIEAREHEATLFEVRSGSEVSGVPDLEGPDTHPFAALRAGSLEARAAARATADATGAK